MLILDVEGSDNGDKTYNTRLSTLANILSSICLLNVKGPRFVTSALEYIDTIKCKEITSELENMMCNDITYVVRDVNNIDNIERNFREFLNRSDTQNYTLTSNIN